MQGPYKSTTPSGCACRPSKGGEWDALIAKYLIPLFGGVPEGRGGLNGKALGSREAQSGEEFF